MFPLGQAEYLGKLKKGHIIATLLLHALLVYFDFELLKPECSLPYACKFTPNFKYRHAHVYVIPCGCIDKSKMWKTPIPVIGLTSKVDVDPTKLCLVSDMVIEFIEFT